MELSQASKQWFKRPHDERYSNLAEMYDQALRHRHSTRIEKSVPLASLQISPEGKEELTFSGQAEVPAHFTHWSFSQLCARVGAPASYLRSHPAEFAASCLNYDLKQSEDTASLLFNADEKEGLTLRAATSEKYSRIWNHEIIERLLDLPEHWNPAPEAFDGSRGLYASAHDMFAFMVDNDRRIFESDPAGGLARGFFVENSEVGSSAFRLTTFLYRFVCGNHIVWGAENVDELSIRHVGTAHEIFAPKMMVELKRYSEASPNDLETKISQAQKYELGKTKEEVLDFIFGKRILSRKQAGEAYEETEKHPEDGNPRTAWGLAQGITRISQAIPFADKRNELDRAASKVLDILS
jgi:hypothetical protein